MEDNRVRTVQPEGANSFETLPVSFVGDGREFFRIWIVSALLSALTFGIYTAWATVRKKRFFYSNCFIRNDHFQYLATPLQILKGRMTTAGCFLVYGAIAKISPTAGKILSIAIILLIPYLFNQSMTFNARMSTFKGIPFKFDPDYRQAFMVVFVWPALALLTLGILLPRVILEKNNI